MGGGGDKQERTGVPTRKTEKIPACLPVGKHRRGSRRRARCRSRSPPERIRGRAEGRGEEVKKETERKRTKKECARNSKERGLLAPFPGFALPLAPPLPSACRQGRRAVASLPIIPVGCFWCLPAGRQGGRSGALAVACGFSAVLCLLFARFSAHLGVHHAIEVLQDKAGLYPERFLAVRTGDPELQLLV